MELSTPGIDDVVHRLITKFWWIGYILAFHLKEWEKVSRKLEAGGCVGYAAMNIQNKA